MKAETVKKEWFEEYQSFHTHVIQPMFLSENRESKEIARILQVQYQILYRQWNELDMSLDYTQFATQPTYQWKEGSGTWETTEQTIENMVEMQYGYLSHYLETRGKKYQATLGYGTLMLLLGRGNNENEVANYRKIALEEGKKVASVVDTYFCGVQPILNVLPFDFQKKAMRSLEEHDFHFIFDEVGTGKSVSALYCIQKIIQERGAKAKILILCPHNKKVEWEADVKRQLGLKAHMVQGSGSNYEDNYKDDFKVFYFMADDPCIFIKNQIKNVIDKDFQLWGEESTSTGKVLWDLVVIDEGHLCFENYTTLRSKKAVLLTATPTVAYSQGNEVYTRSFGDYIQLMDRITYKVGARNQYELPHLFQESPLFSQHFREDFALENQRLGGAIAPALRKIRFLKPCKRWELGRSYLYQIKEVKKFFTYVAYEQDDQYLCEGLQKFREELKEKGIFVPDFSPEAILKRSISTRQNDYLVVNHKLNTLLAFLLEEKQWDNVEESPVEQKVQNAEEVFQGSGQGNLNETVKEDREKKSYIVFFNHRSPARNGYKSLEKRLFEEPEHLKVDTLLVLKFGEGEEEHQYFSQGKNFGNPYSKNALKDQDMMVYMQRMIASGVRVLFFTTGQTGGTGVNLGNFHGVIHYELPFTSIELEQRFGRVDRMDQEGGEGEKEMVFLLNEDKNPMLTYSTEKAHEICKFMPTRNTILFHPEFNKENWKRMKLEWEIGQELLDCSEMAMYEECAKKICDIAQLGSEAQEELKKVDALFRLKKSMDHQSLDLQEYNSFFYCKDFLEYLTEPYLNTTRFRAVLSMYESFVQYCDSKQELLLWSQLFTDHRLALGVEEEAFSIGMTFEEGNAAVSVEGVEVVSGIHSPIYVAVEEQENMVYPVTREAIEEWKETTQRVCEFFKKEPNFAEISTSGLFYHDNNKNYRVSVEEYRRNIHCG